MPFLLMGLNHNSAPVEVREVFAGRCISGFPGADGRTVEGVAVLTCNRVEAYFSGPYEAGEYLFSQWVNEAGLPAGEVQPYLYKKTHDQAVRHLFHVTSGLDSLVLGESQILGQVKESYQAAIEARTVGKNLHSLFQKALEVGKRVRSETRISENTVSIASTAVDLATHIFGPLNDSTVFLIGAGEMGTLVARHLQDKQAGTLLFTNRTLQRAQDLAQTFNGQAFPFSELEELLKRADIVVSSTGAPRPVITRDMLQRVMQARASKPLFLIDIAVPRDVEAACDAIENVFLYNVDDLQGVVDENMNVRKQEAQKARGIIDEEVAQFQTMMSAFSVVPLIRSLREKAEEFRKGELERFLAKHKDLPAPLLEDIEQFSQGLLAKWLHHPIVALKQRSSGGREELAGLAGLFGLPETVIPQTPLVVVPAPERQEPILRKSDPHSS
jgi:glutamyl-tRNA reductase